MSFLPVTAALALAMLLTAPAATGAPGGGMALQTVPILPDPSQLTGDWVISGADTSVVVGLSARPAAPRPGAQAWTLELRSGAMESVGLEAARAWRPAPDGIALVADDGATVAFFSAEGADRYVYHPPSGPVVLARARS